jgi:short-subunit dehydrogenase
LSAPTDHEYDIIAKTIMATVVVTGASGGIGRALAGHFARDRYDLMLVSRNAERLGAVAQELRQGHGVPVTTLSLDLSDPAAPEALWAEVERRGMAVDVLVNNAGVGVYGPFVDAVPDRLYRLIRLNVEALVALTRLALPGMLARRRGRIVNLASTAAFAPGPRMAVYYASKAFVLSFSEGLAFELRGTGVTVTAVCPGPTLTGFQRAAGMEGRNRPKAIVLPVERVARLAYRGAMRGRRLVVPGFANLLMAQSTRLAPRWLVTAVSGFYNRMWGEA